MARKPTTTNEATATDQVDAEVQSAIAPIAPKDEEEAVDEEEEEASEGVSQSANPLPAIGGAGTPLNLVATPEHALSVLKEKISLLHQFANNAGHFATLAFNEVEQLVVDIQRLTTYIRSKA